LEENNKLQYKHQEKYTGIVYTVLLIPLRWFIY